MEKIRKGDEVVVITGKDKGKRGTVVPVLMPSMWLSKGVNRAKKHVKPNPMKGVAGGIVDKDMPIHISNVALFNPATKKADRVGIKVLEDGPQKVRVFKSNGELVERIRVDMARLQQFYKDTVVGSDQNSSVTSRSWKCPASPKSP